MATVSPSYLKLDGRKFKVKFKKRYGRSEIVVPKAILDYLGIVNTEAFFGEFEIVSDGRNPKLLLTVKRMPLGFIGVEE